MMRRKERSRKKQKQGGQNENEQRDEIYDRFMTYISTLSQPTNQNPGRVPYCERRRRRRISKRKIQM